ncbi:ATP-binding protein [Candidatus Pacearchaeota archaeon]|nr:ATP-binding protein [Candidatus Pacearchaeota archaeon]
MEKNTSGKFRLIAINIIRLLLVAAFLGALSSHRELVILFSIVGLAATFFPFIMSKLFDIKISKLYEIIIVMFLYGSLFLGEIRGLFVELWWWDILLNISASILLGFVGFSVIYTFYKDKEIRANPVIISFLSFCFTIAMGSLWEVVEFSLDYFLGFHLQKSIMDTMLDIISNSFGALIIAIFGYYYMKDGGVKVVSEFIVKIIEKNPIFFKRKDTIEASSEEILRTIKRGESKNLEFKSTLRTNLHTNEPDNKIEHVVLKTITAFLNSDGGILLIGVDDSGNVSGLEKDNFRDNDSLKLYFTNIVKRYIGNEFIPFIEFELFPVKDKHVLKIDCLPSKKPVFLNYEKEEEFYIRSGPSSAKLIGRELIEYIKHKFG